TTSRYETSVLNDGAADYWRVDETVDGTFADTVSGNDGIWTAGPDQGVPGALTDGDLAVQLDGSSQYGTVDANIDFTTTMTVEAWVETADTSSDPSVVWREDAGGPSYGLGLAAAHPTAVFNAGQFGPVTLTDPSTIDDGWHYLVGTFDNGEATLYVDG